MIEVEKKFQPTEEQLEKMLVGAEFLGEVVNVDKYYDTDDFKYIKEGSRIRERNGAFELKLKVVNPENPDNNYFEEIEDEKEILKKLNLDTIVNLREFINTNLVLLCSINTNRKKYKKDDFSIDIDQTDFGFDICEIELLVEGEEDINKAEKRIIEFADKYGISVKEKISGKVMEYLKRFNPELYEELFEIKYKVKSPI